MVLKCPIRTGYPPGKGQGVDGLDRAVAMKPYYLIRVTVVALLFSVSTAMAEPTLEYPFPDYRMAASNDSGTPSELAIDINEHISNYESVEVTWDFPGTIETFSWFRLYLHSTTELGKGSVYLNVTDEDGATLSESFSVEVVPFASLPAVDVACYGETEGTFVATWKFPRYRSGFPSIGGYRYRLSGGGVERGSSVFLGDGWDATETNHLMFSKLPADSRFQFELRTYSNWSWGPSADSTPVTVTCSTKHRGYRAPAPEVTDVHVFQGALVDTFPQGGRQPKTPLRENRDGMRWRAPLVLDKETTVVAAALFQDWNDTEVRINGGPAEHGGRIQPDAETGLTLGLFARSFPSPPDSIVVTTGHAEAVSVPPAGNGWLSWPGRQPPEHGTPDQWDIDAVEILHADYRLGTVQVPDWTVLLVPVETPNRQIEVGEYTKQQVRRALQVWPFGKLNIEIADSLISPENCEESSDALLHQLREEVAAAPQTTVIGLMGGPNGGGNCRTESGSRLAGLAFLNEPYSVVVCGETHYPEGCLPNGFAVAHEFGHTAGLLHEDDGSSDCTGGRCGDGTYPYFGALIAPYLDKASPVDASIYEDNQYRLDWPVDDSWVKTPVHWRHDRLIYGWSVHPNGEPAASGAWFRPTLWTDLMSPSGWYRGNSLPYVPRRAQFASDHNYRKVLRYIRGETEHPTGRFPVIVQ